MSAKQLLKETLLKHGDLTEEEWDFIADRFSHKSIPKGAYYLREHHVCNKMGFVVHGLMRNYSIDKEGNEITTHFNYEGIFALSFLSFKQQIPSSENIQALTEVEVLEISHQQLQSLFKQSLQWRLIYAGLIEEAYACMLERMYILQNYAALEKYNALITRSHPDIIMKAPLKHISSYLGIQLETLSRIRKSLSAR